MIQIFKIKGVKELIFWEHLSLGVLYTWLVGTNLSVGHQLFYIQTQVICSLKKLMIKISILWTENGII
jgi:hypothetical protein